MAAGLAEASPRPPATASTAQPVAAAVPLHALPGDWWRVGIRFALGLAGPLAACVAAALAR